MENILFNFYKRGPQARCLKSHVIEIFRMENICEIAFLLYRILSERRRVEFVFSFAHCLSFRHFFSLPRTVARRLRKSKEIEVLSYMNNQRTKKDGVKIEKSTAKKK